METHYQFNVRIFQKTIFIFSLFILFTAIPFPHTLAQQKINVTIGMHIENFTDAVKEAQATRKVVELANKYGMKVEFDISNWVSEEIQKYDPDLIRMIKDLRLPLRGTTEQHLSFQIERTRDKSWDEGVRNILAYQTQYLNKLTGISDPSRPGGWVSWENIWGTTTMTPGNGTSFGGEMAHYVEHQLRATGAQYNGKAFEESPMPRPEIQGGISLSYGWQQFLPGEFVNNPNSFYSYDQPGGLPQRDPVEDLKFMMEKYTISSIRISNHMGYFYQWHLNPGQWLTAYFSGGRPTVLYGAPNFPKWKEDAIWKRYSDLIEYIGQNPDKFRVVNRDPDEHQWKAKLPAPRDMNKFPWIPPDEQDLTKSQYISAAQQIIQRMGRVPQAVTVDGVRLTRSEMFSAFVEALDYYSRSNTLPSRVKAVNLIGPVDLPNSSNGSPSRAHVSGTQVIERAAMLSRIIGERVPARMISLDPIGLKENSNIVADLSQMPLWVDSPDAAELTIKAEVRANPASFIHLMAEVITDINTTGSPSSVTYWQIPVVIFENNLRFVDGVEGAQLFTVNEGKFYNVQSEVLSRKWIDWVYNTWTRKPDWTGGVR